MPCDTVLQPNQTLPERVKQIDAALKRLEAALSAGKVTISIGTNGAIAFKSWAAGERSSVTDVCAYRTLSAGNSWALRQAVARAEATSGRKVNERAIAAGTHSHDGGKSWDPGH